MGALWMWDCWRGATLPRAAALICQLCLSLPMPPRLQRVSVTAANREYQKLAVRRGVSYLACGQVSSFAVVVLHLAAAHGCCQAGAQWLLLLLLLAWASQAHDVIWVTPAGSPCNWTQAPLLAPHTAGHQP